MGVVPSSSAIAGWSRSPTYLRTTASRCRSGSRATRPHSVARRPGRHPGRPPGGAREDGLVVGRHRPPTTRPVHVHGAAVGDGQQPAAQVPGRGEPRVCGVRLGPRLLGHVVAVDRTGEGSGQPGDVAPVVVDESLEGGKVHTDGTPTSWSCESRLGPASEMSCASCGPRNSHRAIEYNAGWRHVDRPPVWNHGGVLDDGVPRLPPNKRAAPPWFHRSPWFLGLAVAEHTVRCLPSGDRRGRSTPPSATSACRRTASWYACTTVTLERTSNGSRHRLDDDPGRARGPWTGASGSTDHPATSSSPTGTATPCSPCATSVELPRRRPRDRASGGDQAPVPGRRQGRARGREAVGRVRDDGARGPGRVWVRMMSFSASWRFAGWPACAPTCRASTSASTGAPAVPRRLAPRGSARSGWTSRRAAEPPDCRAAQRRGQRRLGLDGGRAGRHRPVPQPGCGRHHQQPPAAVLDAVETSR